MSLLLEQEAAEKAGAAIHCKMMAQEAAEKARKAAERAGEARQKAIAAAEIAGSCLTPKPPPEEPPPAPPPDDKGKKGAPIPTPAAPSAKKPSIKSADAKAGKPLDVKPSEVTHKFDGEVGIEGFYCEKKLLNQSKILHCICVASQQHGWLSFYFRRCI